MHGVSNSVVAASIAAAASILVVLLGQFATARSAQRAERARREQEIAATYLNPLRLQALEIGIQISSILREQPVERQKVLGFLPDVGRLKEHGIELLAGHGTYLGASAYMTACLFGEFVRVRDDNPFIRLKGGVKDTELTAAMWEVGTAFSRNDGVYPPHQGVIGREMLLTTAGRLRSYREFCDLIIGEHEVWFRSLIAFYDQVGHDKRIDQLEEILTSVRALLRLLDNAVGGEDSYATRLGTEEKKARSISW